MQLNSLKQLYPDSYFSGSPLSDPSVLNFIEQDRVLIIPIAHLEATEVDLLRLLQKEFFALKSKPISNNPWFHFLFGEGTLPKANGQFRVLQFFISDDASDLAQWLANLAEMFEQTQASFLLNPHLAIIIEKQSNIPYSTDEIEGILKTLENDFGVRAKGFIGNFMPATPEFKAITNELITLFKNEHTQIKNNQVITFEEISLFYLTKKSFQESPLFSYLKKQIDIDDEMKEIILSLWHNQGNISSSAKELFMHRNTLRYRVEKFSEQTSLSLKTMDGLALSYLFVLHHQKSTKE